MPSATSKKGAETDEAALDEATTGRVRRLRSASTVSGTERLNINLHVTTARALRELSEAKGVTATEIVRRAIAILKLLEEQQARGIEIHLVDPADKNKVRILEMI